MVDAASRLLLRLSRVRQYDALLANPTPGGSVDAVYRFRTVEKAPSAAAQTPASDAGGGALPVALVALSLLGAGGLVVLWAQL
jgi:hypothetical protein